MSNHQRASGGRANSPYRLSFMRCCFNVAGTAILASSSTGALAQDSLPPKEATAPTPAAVATQITTPAMAGPLTGNAKPGKLDAGPFGEVYVTGVASGLGLTQDHVVPGDKHSRIDISNGQIFIQKIDGPIQFFIQAGVYSLPALGAGYVKAKDVTPLTYDYIPQAFVKLVPSDHFNILIGKLPTLQGNEYTFTFENMNINRGLLWNQENAVNRGIQANFSRGKLSVSVSLNDGYYSAKYNWLSGLVSYAATPRDTIVFVAAANLGTTRKSSFATPLLQNNGELYNIIYTHSEGALTISPYLQLTRVHRKESLGIDRSAGTFGAAVLVKYTLTPQFAMAARAEYIRSRGGRNSGRPNLLYGLGSKAYSLTLTPTYQHGIFFARAELAYVHVTNSTVGFAFGQDLSKKSQTRGTLEAGFLF